jgi:hypothetical protein
VSQRRTLWEEGREPGRQVVVLGFAVALTLVLVNLLVAGRLGLFFDLCFVTLCLGLALAVRPGDFLTVGLLPPLLMIAVFALVALTDPTAIAAAGDSLVQAVVSGLAAHSEALLAGYALCLGTLAHRQRVLSRSAQGDRLPPDGVSPRSASDLPRRA